MDSKHAKGAIDVLALPAAAFTEAMMALLGWSRTRKDMRALRRTALQCFPSWPITCIKRISDPSDEDRCAAHFVMRHACQHGRKQCECLRARFVIIMTTDYRDQYESHKEIVQRVCGDCCSRLVKQAQQ